MPLIIDDLVYDKSKFKSFYDDYPSIKEACNQFKSKPIRFVYPHEKYLYLNQGEYAIVNRDDENIDIIGSDEATTCCLLFLQAGTSYAVAHIDDTIQFNSLIQLVNELLVVGGENNNQFNSYDVRSSNAIKLTCQLIGSYKDEKDYSIKLLYKLLSYLNRIPNVIIDLKLACVLEMNTKIIQKDGHNYNCPIYYGCAIELSDQRTNGRQSSDDLLNISFPAEFVERDPEIVLRKVRHLCQKKDLVQVYNSLSKVFVIDKFIYNPIDRYYVEKLVNSSDQFILDNCSTSPHVEPPHFVEICRQVYKLMAQRKDEERPHRFKRQNNGWMENSL